MSINVKWIDKCHFKATTKDGFSVDIDADNRVAPCPTEALLYALGACSATDVVLLLQEKGAELQSLENNVTHTLTEGEPRLYQSANLHFVVKGKGFTESDVLAAAEEAISKHCHVCLMLQPQIDIRCTVEII
ncbi:OsmC family protein [Photobacterium aquae]|uniref:OsmC family protein n=1 Tax=Photobacterium aquae TaxID=1195763 RepID=A0A0J1H029_9GAMM|nr:OsmC family protein [Photobacterium aquae]KLV05169.1 OsmC family protein [Photobacterium aquae]